MNHNNLNGLFFPAVAGLFFFMKRPKAQEIEAVSPIYTRDPSGLTGVSRYLEEKAMLFEVANEKLLKNLEPAQIASSVSRYLEQQKQVAISGVAKYVLRQSISAKQNKQIPVEIQSTGVEKYLKNKKDLPGLSGVAKYLKNQASLPQPSKVSKYMARQAILAASQAEVTKNTVVQFEKTGVARYLQHQDSLPQPSRVAKYLAKKSALAALQVKVVDIELTGVAKYLHYQASLPQPSRVAKYVAKQAALAEKNQATHIIKSTSVAQYLKLQEELPQSSKVEKYMARQALIEKQKPIVIETSVDRYMRHQA
jgi:hypothetical protein